MDSRAALYVWTGRILLLGLKLARIELEAAATGRELPPDFRALVSEARLTNASLGRAIKVGQRAIE
jgi:hypothetical protein